MFLTLIQMSSENLRLPVFSTFASRIKERVIVLAFSKIKIIFKKIRGCNKMIQRSAHKQKSKNAPFGTSPFFDSVERQVSLPGFRSNHLQGSAVFGPALCFFFSVFNFQGCFCARVSDCESVPSSDLSGGDLLKVDVVAATANLIVVRVPALQLHAQLPHHPLQVTVSTVHQDVVLLQLLLVADDLDVMESGGWGVGGGGQSVRGQRERNGWKPLLCFYLFLLFLPHPPFVLKPREIVLTHPPLIHEFSL